MNNNYPYAPENYSERPEYSRKLKTSINSAMNGKTNNTGEITVTPGASSSTFIDNLCNINSVVLLSPITANAGIHHNGLYVVAGDKSFTVHHASSAVTDRSYRYVIVG